jgi:hypothetical protein
VTLTGVVGQYAECQQGKQKLIEDAEHARTLLTIYYEQSTWLATCR